MAKKWFAMSIRYKALRVTDPEGQQSSTYFLQLPYRYRIPLIVISTSISLQWVLSGCIYLLVMQGDYFDQYTLNGDFSSSTGPLSSSTALGFSTKLLLVMMTLGIALVFIPGVFRFISLPRHSLVVGSNSFAIAAACQVSPLVGQSQARHDRSSTESSQHGRDDSLES